MKKNILALFACVVFIGFTACEDYNKDNFGIDDDANHLTAVENYKVDYDGDYPNGEYFVDKAVIEERIGPWLEKMFYACDVKSTADVSKVLFADVLPEETVKVSFKDTLQTADYDAMGEESGCPGKYNNFDKNMDLNYYINIYLNAKYPYKTDKSVAAVAIDFYISGQGATTDSTVIFKKEEKVWSVQNVRQIKTTTGEGDQAVTTYSWMYTEKELVSARIAQMEKQATGWKLKRLIGGVKMLTMGDEHYQMLLDKFKERLGKGEVAAFYWDPGYTEDAEYYYGSSVKHYNINNVYRTWRLYYNPATSNPELVNYNDLSDEELQALMDKQLAEGIADVLLPAMVSEPDTGLSYVVVYNVYGGRGNGNYGMTFMYNEETSTWEKTANPIAQ